MKTILRLGFVIKNLFSVFHFSACIWASTLHFLSFDFIFFGGEEFKFLLKETNENSTPGHSQPSSQTYANVSFRKHLN